MSKTALTALTVLATLACSGHAQTGQQVDFDGTALGPDQLDTRSRAEPVSIETTGFSIDAQSHHMSNIALPTVSGQAVGK